MAAAASGGLTPDMPALAFYETLRSQLNEGDNALRRAFIADAILARVPSEEDWVVCGQMAVTGRCRDKGDLDLVPRGFLLRLREAGITDPASVGQYVEMELRRLLAKRVGDPLLLAIPKDSLKQKEGGLRLIVHATVDRGHGNKQVGELPVDVPLDPDTVSVTPRLAKWSFSGLTADLWPGAAVNLQDVREVFAGKLFGAYQAATHPEFKTQFGLKDDYMKYLGDCADILEQKLVDDNLSQDEPQDWIRSNLEFIGLDEIIAAKAAENGLDPRVLIDLPDIPEMGRTRWRRKAVADYLGGDRICSYHADLQTVREAVDQALAGPMDPRPVLGRAQTRSGVGPMAIGPNPTPAFPAGAKLIPRSRRP